MCSKKCSHCTLPLPAYMRIAKFGLDVQNLWTSQVETTGPLQQNSMMDFPPKHLGQESQLEFHCWSSSNIWWAIQNLQNFQILVAESAWLGGINFIFKTQTVQNLPWKSSSLPNLGLRIRSVDASSIPGGIRRNLPAVSPRWNPKQPEDVTEIHPVLLFWGWEQGRKDLGKLYIIPTQIT